MARQANPKLQQANPSMFSRSSRMKSSADYLKQLDELLKRNKGGFNTVAEETGAEGGFIVPGGVPVKMGQFVPQTAGQTDFTNVARPQYPEIPETQYDSNLDTNYQSDQMTANDFLNQLNQVYSQTNPQAPGTTIGQPGQMATGVQETADGGVLFTDGIIYYPDGTFRQGDASAEPVASHQSGGTQYSDGSVRMSYEQVGLPQQSIPGGLGGLLTGIFGQQRDITQEYGNYNPELEPGSGYNLGTDIRTKDLTGTQRGYRLPVDAEVVQVFQDDGTRWGTQSGHQGYGNSVLLRLPSGEMLRFSHMGNMANLQPGMRISAGETFGTPGQTGNVTGEHLDLEYYNSQGQIDNPQNFSGFQNATTLAQPKLFSSPDDPQAQVQQQEQPQSSGLLQQVQQARQSGSSIMDAIAGVPTVNAVNQIAGDSLKGVGQALQTEPVQNVARQAGEAIAPTVEKVQPTGEFDLGVTEGLITPEAAQTRLETVKQSQPSTGLFGRARQSLGNLTEAIGDTFGVPEGNLSEVIAGGPTRRTNQVLASEINQAQEPNQSRESLGILDRAKDFVGGLFSGRGQADVSVNDLQPGAGIEKLKSGDSKSGGAGVNLFSRRSPEDMSGSRVVGESSGANLLGGQPTVAQAMAQRRNDTTDPFFFSPTFEKVRGFTNFEGGKPGADQALSLDIFNQQFYDAPERASDVFSGTFLQDPALTRATNQVKEQFRQRYSGDEYDQADVNRILSELPATLNYTPNLPEPKKKVVVQPSLADYLAMGKRLDQWYAEVAGQDKLDAMGGPDSDAAKRQIAEAQRSPVNQAVVAASQGKQLVSPSGNVIRNYSPANANMSDAYTGLPVNAQEKASNPVGMMSREVNQSKAVSTPKRKEDSGIFSKAKSFASGIFNRFFN